MRSFGDGPNRHLVSPCELAIEQSSMRLAVAAAPSRVGKEASDQRRFLEIEQALLWPAVDAATLGLAIELVGGWTTDEQVTRIEARRVIAVVANQKARWNLSSMYQFPKHAMGGGRNAAIELNVTITSLEFRSGPKPAIVHPANFDFGPERFETIPALDALHGCIV